MTYLEQVVAQSSEHMKLEAMLTDKNGIIFLRTKKYIVWIHICLFITKNRLLNISNVDAKFTLYLFSSLSFDHVTIWECSSENEDVLQLIISELSRSNLILTIVFVLSIYQNEITSLYYYIFHLEIKMEFHCGNSMVCMWTDIFFIIKDFFNFPF